MELILKVFIGGLFDQVSETSESVDSSRSVGLPGEAEREQTRRAHAPMDPHGRASLAVRQSVRARPSQWSIRRQDL